MLQHEELTSRPIPLLFLANKMDLAGSSTPEELCEILNLGIVVIFIFVLSSYHFSFSLFLWCLLFLASITNHPWRIVSTNGISGLGIAEGIDWLCEEVEEFLCKK